MTTPNDRKASLELLLRQLKLPSFSRFHEEAAIRAERESWSFGQYLYHLVEVELDERRQRRLQRNLKRSDLPQDKSLATLKQERYPARIRRQIAALCEGHFVDAGENVLVFGLPGRGKSHICAAIAHELIHRGYTVLFTPAFQLVQRLLAAKRDLALEKLLRQLDRFDVVLVDDIGYIQQSREEMEVLFTFLAERYERRSVVVTSNLVFSQWDKIFKDPMTTAAAIDRLVHHSTIIELEGPSFRADEAADRGTTKEHPDGEV